MNEHRVLVLENKARADIARVLPSVADLRTVMENKCLDILELAVYVRDLEGRLEAVADLVSDADAFDVPVGSEAIMEAVRGES